MQRLLAAAVSAALHGTPRKEVALAGVATLRATALAASRAPLEATAAAALGGAGGSRAAVGMKVRLRRWRCGMRCGPLQLLLAVADPL